MESAKIRLSPEEAALIKNADWILTKNSLLHKVNALLASLQEFQEEALQCGAAYLPHEVLHTTPKISRGENYLGLPWQILDYPRIFTKDHVFAIRTMFWWGRYFSTTLHLSGKWKTQYGETVFSRMRGHEGWRINHTSEWDHDAYGPQYTPVREEMLDPLALQAAPFMKVTRLQSIDAWADLPKLLNEDYGKILWLLAG